MKTKIHIATLSVLIAVSTLAGCCGMEARHYARVDRRNDRQEYRYDRRDDRQDYRYDRRHYWQDYRYVRNWDDRFERNIYRKEGY